MAINLYLFRYNASNFKIIVLSELYSSGGYTYFVISWLSWWRPIWRILNKNLGQYIWGWDFRWWLEFLRMYLRLQMNLFPFRYKARNFKKPVLKALYSRPYKLFCDKSMAANLGASSMKPGAIYLRLKFSLITRFFTYLRLQWQLNLLPFRYKSRNF